MRMVDHAPGAFTIVLFGPMQAFVAGRPFPPVRSRKILWALALLTLRNGRLVDREWLARTLWPDVDPSQAFANLRPVLSQLRTALGVEAERIRSPDRRTLSLDLEGAFADVAAFDQAVASPRLTDLEAAVELYRGPLLEGCGEEWIFQERDSRDRACVEALLRLGEAALRTENHPLAAERYRRATRILPLADAPRRGLIEALAKGGDLNAAFDAYRQFADLLRAEINAEPDQATSELYVRLRREARQGARSSSAGDAEKPSPGLVGNLPQPLTNLVGREEERIEVALQLRRSRLVTLTGPGGIGKTRLAIETAREFAPTLTDGAWLVSLESLSKGDLIERQVASAFGLREEPTRSALDVVVDYLRARRLVLVFDNCEHLLRASARFADRLLRECVGVRILATSREPLGLSGETVWSVPALPYPELDHLPPSPVTRTRVLAAYESVQLFVERAQSSRRDFTLTSLNAMAIAQICARLEGIPLAIELAAARTKAMTVEAIAGRLDDHLRLLTGPGGHTMPARQQTLRATLDWSYALLSSDERHVLRRLSVFAGGWTLAAAERVSAGHEVRESEVADLLQSLVDKSLVVFDEAKERYRLLETVRQYATEKLDAAGEKDIAVQAHFDWYLPFAQKADGQLRGKDHRSWMLRLLQEHDNFRAALEHGLASAKGQGLRLAATLGRFWSIKGEYDEGASYLCESLRGADEAPAELRAEALSALGEILFNRADYGQARNAFEESLSLSRGRCNARCFIGLGRTAHEEGHDDDARRFAAESLRTAEGCGNQAQIAAALLLHADLAATIGEGPIGAGYLVKALALYRELRDEIGLATCLCYLASMPNYEQDRLLRDARLHEALSLFRTLGDRRGTTMVLYVIGRFCILEKSLEEAERYLSEALDLSRSLGNRRSTVLILAGIGQARAMAGDLAGAKTLVEESLEMSRSLTGQGGSITSLEACAAVLLRLQQAERAVSLFGFCAALREKIGSRFSPKSGEANALLLAEANAALGDEAFAGAWKRGEAMSSDEALDFALIQIHASEAMGA